MTTKVFAINVRSSNQRREFIQKQLSKLNIDFEIIDACEPGQVYEKELDLINLSRVYDKELTKLEVACAKSHIKALMTLANDNECTHGLIIEDDVYLSRHLRNILLSLKNVCEEDAIVLLYSQVFKKTVIQKKSELCHDYVLGVSDQKTVYGGQAYFLSKEKANDFSRNLTPIITVADDWRVFLEREYFSNIYFVYPFPVLHAEFISGITVPESAGLRTKIKNFIISHKIFPVYQIYFKLRRRRIERWQKYYIRAPEIDNKKTYKL